jgi:LmbE family N-acetylglucosaminyl deacetylase
MRDATAVGLPTRRAYALARRRELHAALALAAIAPAQTHELGCVDQEATLHLVDLSYGAAALLGRLQPEVVLTLPYEGGHPDHDATAFVVHAAGRLLQAQGYGAPTLIEMTSYHQGAQGIAVYEFLPGTAGEVTTLVLSAVERDFKRRLLDCFPTQRDTLRFFPPSIERFRLAPRYRFTQAPHAGKLFYEYFPWGMSGERFCRLAQQAMQVLGLTGAI